ncbi:aldehyde dehydrogenase [Oricola sp.]|uniref:aldehyde dehydrogenase n=1 Tax=Oricola sp. TaxID=1979950 RepID=UPI0025DF8123|nr:aldehyde dehydrogenase [Oricola sp.]MCI5077401.1 aldehyde dehydrogenase [Oricola sp.]
MNAHETPDPQAAGAVTAEGIAERQRRLFRTDATRSLEFRKRQLRALRQCLVDNEADILDALKRDLGRPPAEAYTSDIGIVLIEIDMALKHLARWARPKRVRTPWLLLPGSSRLVSEPFGSALVIGPWNYPLNLVLAPAVAALAAGNCVVIKPSELAPATSAVMARMIGAAFDPDVLAVIEGGVEPTQALLAQDFDYVFFTGGTRIGKIVMAAAAEHLTPVTLELGGKNPCIVAADADMKVAARRIAWGKFFNAGQTCIAPDFVLVERAAQSQLTEALKAAITEFYGEDPAASADYARIVNERHFDRLAGFLGRGRVVAGGQTDRASRYIAPTVIADVSWDDPVMADEIFGPVLPVIACDDLAAEAAALRERPKPLALYVFSSDTKWADGIVGTLSSGGAAVNDVFAQMLNMDLPFGGVGASGMGAYHGKSGFDTFSHHRAVVRRATWFDPKLRYPPYTLPLAALKQAMARLM